MLPVQAAITCAVIGFSVASEPLHALQGKAIHRHHDTRCDILMIKTPAEALSLARAYSMCYAEGSDMQHARRHHDRIHR